MIPYFVTNIISHQTSMAILFPLVHLGFAELIANLPVPGSVDLADLCHSGS